MGSSLADNKNYVVLVVRLPYACQHRALPAALRQAQRAGI